MKTTTSRLTRVLRLSALLLLAGGFSLWAAGGARIGWTQTSVVEVQRDEITGIDYPVRRDAFVPGVEVPLAGTVAALALAGLTLLKPRRSSRART